MWILKIPRAQVMTMRSEEGAYHTALSFYSSTAFSCLELDCCRLELGGGLIQQKFPFQKARWNLCSNLCRKNNISEMTMMFRRLSFSSAGKAVLRRSLDPKAISVAVCLSPVLAGVEGGSPTQKHATRQLFKQCWVLGTGLSRPFCETPRCTTSTAVDSAALSRGDMSPRGFAGAGAPCAARIHSFMEPNVRSRRYHLHAIVCI